MTEEEKKAIEYYKDEEISFTVDYDTEELLKALGITEEDSFEKHEIRFKTILNLIQKQQAELEKKDEIINRIYDFIWENDCCRYFPEKHNMCNQVLNFDTCLGNCKRHCIKKYFEKKVGE